MCVDVCLLVASAACGWGGGGIVCCASDSFAAAWFTRAPRPWSFCCRVLCVRARAPCVRVCGVTLRGRPRARAATAAGIALARRRATPLRARDRVGADACLARGGGGAQKYSLTGKETGDILVCDPTTLVNVENMVKLNDLSVRVLSGGGGGACARE